MKLRNSLLSCFALIASSAVACAQTTVSNTVGVSATVIESCSISAVSELAFGELSVGTLPADATSSFNVTCTPTTEYSIGLNEGLYGTSTTTRKLGASSTAALSYQLYQDADWASPWGDDAATSKSGLGGVGLAVTHTIYGKIPDQTWPDPGAYTDTVTITVTFE
jgi:spore coat protein U-like protein